MNKEEYDKVENEYFKNLFEIGFVSFVESIRNGCILCRRFMFVEDGGEF